MVFFNQLAKSKSTKYSILQLLLHEKVIRYKLLQWVQHCFGIKKHHSALANVDQLSISFIVHS